MRRLILIAIFSCAACWGAEDWGSAQFLIGRWTGEGTGQPGSGTGSFSFTPDVQGKVLVRRSFAQYPPRDGKSAYRHDDLMVVYRDEASHQLRAIYFDNEDHVIRYVGSAAGETVVFVSEGPSDGARYRLTYMAAGPDRLKLKFEVAPPGKDFATYIDASARRDR